MVYLSYKNFDISIPRFCHWFKDKDNTGSDKKGKFPNLKKFLSRINHWRPTNQ